MQPLCLEVSRSDWIKPGTIWCDLRTDPASGRRLDQRPPEVSSNPNYSMIKRMATDLHDDVWEMINSPQE